MKMKWLGVALAVVMLSLAVVGVASAAEVSGTGWIRAIGAGWAKVDGSGAVVITGHGVCTVWIKGAETIQAEGVGQRFQLGDWAVFVGYNGQITAMGQDMSVRMASSQIEFTAWGRGTVTLRGQGEYWVRGYHGRWFPTGVALSFGESEAEPSTP